MIKLFGETLAMSALRETKFAFFYRKSSQSNDKNTKPSKKIGNGEN